MSSSQLLPPAGSVRRSLPTSVAPHIGRRRSPRSSKSTRLPSAAKSGIRSLGRLGVQQYRPVALARPPPGRLIASDVSDDPPLATFPRVQTPPLRHVHSAQLRPQSFPRRSANLAQRLIPVQLDLPTRTPSSPPPEGDPACPRAPTSHSSCRASFAQFVEPTSLVASATARSSGNARWILGAEFSSAPEPGPARSSRPLRPGAYGGTVASLKSPHPPRRRRPPPDRRHSPGPDLLHHFHAVLQALPPNVS